MKMNRKIIPVKVKYSTSLEKWRGIREFAELNGFDTNKIDAMIAHIESAGDASLEKSYTFEINNLEEFFYSIYSDDGHPCPHCYKYMCSECPMDDDTNDCCKEWGEVKSQMLDYK
jgi:hypothetical protein